MGFLSWISGLLRPRPRVRALPPARSAPARTDVRGPIVPSTYGRIWELGDQDVAMRDAELGGSFLRIAQLCDSMRGDGLIRGLLATRTDGMFGLPLLVDGDPWVEERLRGREAEYDPATGVLLAPRVPGAFERIAPRSEMVKIVADGVMAGAGIGYLDDDPEPGGWRKLRGLDLHYLSYVHHEDAFYYLDRTRGRLRVDEHDGRWALFLPYGRHRPWTYGAWYPCSKAFISKDGALIDRTRWSRFLADGLRYIEMNENASEAHLEEMVRFMRAGWQYTGGLVAPKGYKPGIVESTGKGFEVYSATEDRGDRDVMIALAGQIVTTEGGKGFSAGDIWQDIAASLVQSTAGITGAWTSQDILSPWTRALGLGPDRVRVSWDARPPAQRAAAAEAASKAAESLAKLDEQAGKRGQRVKLAPYLRASGVEVELEDLPGAPGAASSPALPPAPEAVALLPAAPVAEDAAAEELPDDTAVADLAAKMTEHGIDRCEHGRSNRCLLCGVERLRDFEPGPGGPRWRVQWRPIVAPAAAVAVGVPVRDVLPTRLISGLRVAIEYPRGSVRSGTSPHGEAWQIPMSVDYGEILGTTSPDGEPVDAYCGPLADGPVFVVLQVDRDGAFDEPKIMLGFPDEASARRAYLAHAPAWAFGGIAEVKGTVSA